MIEVRNVSKTFYVPHKVKALVDVSTEIAAGEVVGGIHGVSRLGSCAIPECMVMGMTAARTMMKS